MKKTLSVLALWTQMSVATPMDLNYRYEIAESGEKKRGTVSLDIATDKDFASDAHIHKSIFAAKLGTTLQKSLKAFSEICKISPHPIPHPRPVPRPIQPFPPILPPHPPVPGDCEVKRTAVAERLLGQLDKLNQELDGFEFDAARFYETLDLGRSLAKNMKEAKGHYFGRLDGVVKLQTAGPMAGGGLNVTAGGAQDFGFFRKLVKDGRVPAAGTLTTEGFLSEFDLSLTPQHCDTLLCVQPAAAVDKDAGKLYVQVGMQSNVDADSFQRKPLNLGIVLDISGSMSVRDNTEKSRLEWAKQALIKTVQELNKGDILSIVVFDTKSEVLWPAQRVTDKAAIIEKVKALKTKGSTNLEAGLRDGYKLVSEQWLDQEVFENRVILISDAGLNTGVTSEAGVLKLITDYAGEGVGLTAIGLGLNFNQDFIHGITQSRGGNYLFVHSGKDMYRYFESFDFLVTPVAYNFKVDLDLGGIQADLVAAHGVPRKENEPVRSLIDVQTLFFSQNAGGALLLEYDLK